MIAVLAFLRGVPRLLTPKGWFWLGVAVALLALGLWLYSAGRGDERAAQDGARAKVEARAAVGRERAATERTLDTQAVDRRLEEWNHDAERTPDAAPDDRELRRRCRQLRDAGRTGLAQCRGFEG